MTDDTNPFSQQTFQPEPMFTDDQKVTDQPTPPARRARRSRRAAATSSLPSPAVPASPRPKRKYTRRVAAPVTQSAGTALPAPKASLSPELADTETVVRVTAKIIDELRLLSPTIRKQVWTGIGRLL